MPSDRAVTHSGDKGQRVAKMLDVFSFVFVHVEPRKNLAHKENRRLAVGLGRNLTACIEVSLFDTMKASLI
jgi:hypothetical protein